jgi:predicted deacylase
VTRGSALPKADTSETQRVLGVVKGDRPGPTLIGIGGLHGNEPAGLDALRLVLGSLREQPGSFRGELVALAGNLPALAEGRRFLDIDLNRMWGGDQNQVPPDATEVGEQGELRQAILDAATRARGEVYVLDLHTTSGEGGAFTVIGDTLRNRRFARAIPVPLVLGLEELVDGTLLEFLDERGFIAAVFETGQHQEELSASRGEAGLWLALEAAGMVSGEDHRVRAARRYLRHGSSQLPQVLEMRYRHTVLPGEGFRMRPGFRNFQRIVEGEVLADTAHGTIQARSSSRILMPLYQEQGDDGFFVVQEFHTFWLGVSALARHLRLDRLLPLLPGVRFRNGTRTEVMVNRNVARFYALQLFHLLGYRKQRDDGETLVMIRRSHDTP